MGNLVNRKLNTTLVGVNGNAYTLMAHFQQTARRQGWKQGEIDLVLEEARKSDYGHLVATLDDYCEEFEEVWGLACNYYKKVFPTQDELLKDIVESGMDPNYPITLNGKSTREKAIDLIQM